MKAVSPIGPLPDGWQLRPLKEVTTKIGSGATPRGGSAAYLEARANYSLIRSQCVFDRSLDLSTLSFIDDEQAKSLRGVDVRSGDLLLNITGDGVTFGRCCMVNDAALPAVVNQHVAIIRTNPAVLAPGYLLSYLVHPEIKGYIESFNAGGSRRALTKGHIENFQIPFPPLPEQHAIAATLGVLDGKIELNRRMNATLEAMSRALFRDWFVDFGPTRAKMEGRAHYLSSDIWALFPDRLDDGGKPEGWAYEPLLDQAEWINGAAYKNMHFSNVPEALPVIKIAELKNGVTGTTQRTATDLGSRYLIDDGELLFSWSGNPDTSIDTFLWTGGKAWLNQHIFAVRQNGKRSKPFLHTLLKFLKSEFAELARNKQTTGLGHVTKADMQRMMVCAASSEVHQAFDHLIVPIFDQGLGLQKESRTLAQTRDLLLPRLMSGELRVSDPERIVEAAQ